MTSIKILNIIYVYYSKYYLCLLNIPKVFFYFRILLLDLLLIYKVFLEIV